MIVRVAKRNGSRGVNADTAGDDLLSFTALGVLTWMLSIKNGCYSIDEGFFERDWRNQNVRGAVRELQLAGYVTYECQDDLLGGSETITFHSHPQPVTALAPILSDNIIMFPCGKGAAR